MHSISLSGILDAAQGETLKQRVIAAIAEGGSEFRIDMGDVTFMDSAGFGALVVILKKVRDHKGTLELAKLNKQVRLVLELTGTDQAFTIRN